MKILSKDMRNVLGAIKNAGKNTLDRSTKVVTAEFKEFGNDNQDACRTACNVVDGVAGAVVSEAGRAWDKKSVKRLRNDVGLSARMAGDVALETAQHGACVVINYVTEKTSGAKAGITDVVTDLKEVVSGAAHEIQTGLADVLADVSKKITPPKRETVGPTTPKGMGPESHHK